VHFCFFSFLLHLLLLTFAHYCSSHCTHFLSNVAGTQKLDPALTSKEFFIFIPALQVFTEFPGTTHLDMDYPWIQWQIQKFWKGGEDNLSVPSSFITNAHNGLYAFYTKKGGSLKTFWASRGDGPHHPFWIRHCLNLTQPCIFCSPIGVSVYVSGSEKPMAVAEKHAVKMSAMKPPFPARTELAMFGQLPLLIFFVFSVWLLYYCYCL